LSIFDGTKEDTNGINGASDERLITRHNSNPLTYSYYNGTPSTTSSGSNIYIGSHYSSQSSYNWMGDIMAVAYFDETLTSDEINLLETYFMKKYGIIKVCELPSSTAGYNVDSCDTSSEMLTESECTISCASGYSGHSLVSIGASCPVSNGDFTLSGCFDDNAPPSTAQLAAGILSGSKVYFSAASGFTANGNNIAWNSVVGNSSLTGSTTGVSRVLSNSNFANQPTIHMNGSGSYLNDASFNGMTGATDFTKIAVFSSDQSGSVNQVLLADGVTSSIQNYSNNLYSYVGNSSRAQKSMQFATGTPYIHLHTFDSSGASNDEKSTVRLDGTKLTSLTYYGTQATKSTGTGIQIGHANSGYDWYGDLAEYALFDRVLTEDEIQLVENYLRVKYGQLKQCNAGSDTGYDFTNCNTSGGPIPATDCNIGCASGYQSSIHVSPSVTCSTTGANFVPTGCYLPSAVPAYLLYEEFNTEGALTTASYSSKWDTYKDNYGQLTVSDGALKLNGSSHWGSSVITKDTFGRGITLEFDYTSNGEVGNCRGGYNCSQAGLYLYGAGNLPTRNSDYGRPESWSNTNDYAYIRFYKKNYKPQLILGGAFGATEYIELSGVFSPRTFHIEVLINMDNTFEIFVDGTSVKAGSISGSVDLTNYKMEFYGGDYTSPIHKFDNIVVLDRSFNCGLSTTNPGYDTSSCDGSGGNINVGECSVTCATGYNGTAAASCSSEGADFSFTGCQQNLRYGTTYSSCPNALADNSDTAGYYTIDGAGGNPPQSLFCSWAIQTLFSDDLSYLSNTDSTFQSKWDISPSYSDSTVGSGVLRRGAQANNIIISPNYYIQNNSIIELILNVNYASYQWATDEGIFFYPKVNENSISRGVNPRSDNFPNFSTETYGIWTRNWSYNIVWGGNFNDSASNETWFTYQNIIRNGSAAGNGVRKWRIRFVLNNGKLKVKFAHLGDPGYPGRNDITTKSVDMHSDFDYSSVKMEIITHTGLTSIDEFTVKTLYSCSVPDTIPVGYEVTGCSPGDNTTETSCNVTCASGYTAEYLINAFPTMECQTKNAPFTFLGCQPE